MVNNSTNNINKANNKFSHHTTAHKNDFGNLGPGVGQAQQWGGIKLLTAIPAFSLLIILSPTVIEIYVKHKKPAQIRFHPKKQKQPHIVTKITGNINV